MLTLISFFQKSLRMFLLMAAITVIGQVPYKGQSLENRYHEAVNSEKFQKFYWALMTPATWTVDRIVGLIKSGESPLAR